MLEKELIGRDTVNNMLSWNHSGFSAHASVRVETIGDAARIGRYMIRSPLVLERVKWDAERGEVTYRARPRRSKGPAGGLERWDVLEFIARVTDHVPEPGQPRMSEPRFDDTEREYWSTASVLVGLSLRWHALRRKCRRPWLLDASGSSAANAEPMS